MTDMLNFPQEVKNTWGLDVLDDTIYASNIDGAFYTTLDSDVPRLFNGPLVRLTPEGQNQVYQFVPMDGTHLFLVSTIGLFIARRDLTGLRKVRFVREDGSSGGLSHCTYLTRDDNGAYWMTSVDGGLIQFSLSDTVATIQHQLDMKNGVATNTFYAVYPDGLGSFWCSTDLGIVQLDTAQWSFQFYSTPDGIQNKEFNRLSHCMDESGNIYFGGLTSVTGFDPSDFYTRDAVPINLRVLRLEQYSGWENEVVDRTRQFQETGHIRLAPGDNFFVMEVGLSDIFKTKQHQFQY
jgi:hypothetical protein